MAQQRHMSIRPDYRSTTDGRPESGKVRDGMDSATFATLNSSQRELGDRARELAQQKFAARAAGYDREAAYPTEDFADLHRAGLLCAAIPAEFGGSGLGPYQGNVMALWLMTKEF